MSEKAPALIEKSGLLLDSQPLDGKATQSRLADDDGTDGGGDGKDGTDS